MKKAYKYANYIILAGLVLMLLFYIIPGFPHFLALIGVALFIGGLAVGAFTRPPDFVCPNCKSTYYGNGRSFRPLSNPCPCPKCGCLIQLPQSRETVEKLMNSREP